MSADAQGIKPDPQLLREGTIEELLSQVQAAMDNYKGAEQRFMDQLMAQPDATPDEK